MFICFANLANKTRRLGVSFSELASSKKIFQKYNQECIMVRPNEYHSSIKTKVLNMTSAYAAFNRIPIATKEVLRPFKEGKMSELNLHT
jgi:hypothetical protein